MAIPALAAIGVPVAQKVLGEGGLQTPPSNPNLSTANARNVINVVPPSFNLGEILLPYTQGSPALGGQGTPVGRYVQPGTLLTRTVFAKRENATGPDLMFWGIVGLAGLGVAWFLLR